MKLTIWPWNKKRHARVRFSDGQPEKLIRDVRKIVQENGVIWVIGKSDMLIAA